jgi:hypothetical protein
MARFILSVKVVPGARQTRVVGMLGDALKLQVAVAPEHGKANQAVVELLAGFFGVKTAQVTVVAGLSSPRKQVAIEGIDPTAATARLRAL